MNLKDRRLISKFVIIGITFIIALILGVRLFNLRSQQIKKLAKPTSTPQVKKFELSKKLKEYTDLSGFTFKYPDNLKVRRVSTEDESLYSSIEVYSDRIIGGISIKISDTKLKNLKEYINENKISPKSSTSRGLKLSDIEGTEIRTKKRILMIAIDQKILYEVKVDLTSDAKIWDETYKKIISTFEFTKSGEESSGEESSAVESSDDSVVEEEEVIE